MSLARMIELTEGSVTIDGLDLSSLSPTAIRRQLNIVPQEPYLFGPTVSECLDPFGESSLQAMRLALERVQLWNTIEASGGLEGPLNIYTLSQGQRQLFALARAILRPSKVVLLDEISSKYEITLVQRWNSSANAFSAWTRSRMRPCNVSSNRSFALEPSYQWRTGFIRSWITIVSW